MIKKKDLPLVILKVLEPFVNLKNDKYEVLKSNDILLHIIDKDPNSNFHFKLLKFEKSSTNNSFKFLMSKCPRSSTNPDVYQGWIDISSSVAQFEDWSNLLNEYETINYFEDPITKSFQEEFYSEFEIVDDIDNTKPLNIKQILLLDSYLENVESKLVEFLDEENSIEIQDIQKQIITLRENLTNKSKKWVVEKLTTIWAKIAKQGTKFVKEFLSETKKEVIKQGVKGLIEYVKENGHELLS